MQVAEISKHLVSQLMSACHSILSSDSEENGMIAQRVLFDMHKIYKQQLEEQSAPFFQWLQQVCLCNDSLYDLPTMSERPVLLLSCSFTAIFRRSLLSGSAPPLRRRVVRLQPPTHLSSHRRLLL